MLAMTDEQYLTVEEVAKELRVSVDLVSKWMKAGELTSYRLARNAVRIKRVDLDRFLESRKNTKPEES